MSNVVIQVENLSKQYRLGQVGKKTLHHDINRWLYRLIGREDPYLKIGEENNREQKGSKAQVKIEALLEPCPLFLHKILQPK